MRGITGLLCKCVQYSLFEWCWLSHYLYFGYFQLRFDVPQLYKFHKKKEVDIAVDLWRFVPWTGWTDLKTTESNSEEIIDARK